VLISCTLGAKSNAIVVANFPRGPYICSHLSFIIGKCRTDQAERRHVPGLHKPRDIQA